jgi:hypothetical protein
MLRAH